jgi:sialate O-acetylesterase
MKTMQRLLILLLVLLVRPATAGVRLATILSDHMVLQQGMPIHLWGWDEPGTAVTLKLNGKRAEAKADSDGAWRVELPAMPAGGPFELEVKGSSELTVRDVLLGELWLGSGQSNMEFAMRATHDKQTEIPAANDPQIRLFTVERVTSDLPVADVKGSWKVCSPDTAKDFSAVAYHFGKNLRAFLKTPVGLIAASWGGTPGEDWIPRPALGENPKLAPLVKAWDSDPAHKAPWYGGLPYDLQVSQLRFIPKNPKKKPLEFKLSPKNFGHSEKSDSSGAVDFHGKTARYHGKVMGGSWGSGVLSFDSGKPVDLSDYEAVEFKAQGTGTLAVALGQTSIADNDFYISKNFELKDAQETQRLSIAEFKQGGWGQSKPFTQDQVISLSFVLRSPFWPELGASTYNGMIAPLSPLSLKGVLWYQGESNAGRPEEYQSLLLSLAESWRQEFKQPDLYFLIVQLPLFKKACDEPCESEWARLRESQRLAVKEAKNAELCTILDLGEANDIHPKNKNEVGRRLAGLATQALYGSKLDAAGPRFESLKSSGTTLLASFGRGGKGLKIHGEGETLIGFEVAGADGKFSKALARIKGMQVLVTVPEAVSAPKTLRYAWADNPQGNLWGANELPATPFQAELP